MDSMAMPTRTGRCSPVLRLRFGAPRQGTRSTAAKPEVHVPSSKETIKARLARYRQIKISVIGRKSGRTISIPVWFVLEGEKLYLLPVQGSARWSARCAGRSSAPAAAPPPVPPDRRRCGAASAAVATSGPPGPRAPVRGSAHPLGRGFRTDVDGGGRRWCFRLTLHSQAKSASRCLVEFNYDPHIKF